MDTARVNPLTVLQGEADPLREPLEGINLPQPENERQHSPGTSCCAGAAQGSGGASSPVAWLKVDMANPPEDGVYWARVCYPECDGDVDDYGKTYGIPTGNVMEHVALVHASFSEEHGAQYEPLDRWNLGSVPEEAWVSHVMAVAIPRFAVSVEGGTR